MARAPSRPQRAARRSGPGSRPGSRPAHGQAPCVNLALQGGGAHGAFTWGVLDALLEDGRLDLASVSATSAGSLNAVVLAQGLLEGGREGARRALAAFWSDVAKTARMSPLRPLWMGLSDSVPLEWTPHYWAFETWTRAFSPYQFNPLNLNPLRELLEEHVDFDALRLRSPVGLHLCATNVRTGKIRVFPTAEVSADAVLASACLPQLFQAVEIDGEAYWDGGYLGNPAIFPLIYERRCFDVLVVHVNPVVRKEIPRTAAEIANRMNEISFNSSLMREMRAIAFFTDLIEAGRISEGEAVRMHCIRADELMSRFSVSSKLDPQWQLLCTLCTSGRAEAQAWLQTHLNAVGHRSSVDIRGEFL